MRRWWMRPQPNVVRCSDKRFGRWLLHTVSSDTFSLCYYSSIFVGLPPLTLRTLAAACCPLFRRLPGQLEGRTEWSWTE